PAEIIREAIFISYCGDEQRLLQGTNALRRLEPAEPLPVERQPIQFRPPAGEVAKFLAALIDYGFSRNASDIHLIPKSGGSFIRMRVNGELLSNSEPICSNQIHSQLAARVKVLAGLDSSLRHLPLDGAFSVPIGERIAQIRVSTVPTIHGEKI